MTRGMRKIGTPRFLPGKPFVKSVVIPAGSFLAGLILYQIVRPVGLYIFAVVFQRWTYSRLFREERTRQMDQQDRQLMNSGLESGNPGGGSLRFCQRRQPEQQRSQSHAAIKWGARSRYFDVWLAVSSREPWLGGDGASRRRAVEHGRPKVRLKWERTSGTSCAVACHAESERLLVPLGRQGNGKRRLNHIDSAARL